MGRKEKLFDQFPPISTKEWMDKINSDLKGADFNEKLVWKTKEGFDVKPFYRAEDVVNLMYISSLPGEFPFIKGTKINDNNWYIRQNIEVSDYSEANRKALNILMKGVDSLGFIITDPESVSENNFKVLLSDIHIEIIEINFLCNGKAKEILDLIIMIAKGRNIDMRNIRGAIEADPIGRLMVNGRLCVPLDSGFDYLASVSDNSSVLPNLRTLHLNASLFTNSGATIVQEVAFGISMGCEYMTQFTERGLTTDFAASRIRFSFGIGSDYFLEIAKLRAARLLWSVVIKGFEPECGEKIKMDIHCVTSEWNKTVFDPYVNMLRTQTEAMSAILGGTNSLTVEPFDKVFREPDEFTERIARNQQLILKEESYFDKVADPASGSYYIENLTNMIADNAWKLFLEVEAHGGFISSLKNGFIQKRLSESAEKRKVDITNGKEILLGTNLFPDENEKAPSGVELNRIFKSKEQESDFLIETINLFRGAEEFERLRIIDEIGGDRKL